MRALYWFREDLRLEDNPALTALCADADEAVFVFVQPDTAAWSRSPERMGEHRSRFMAESVMALDQALREHGNQLVVLHGDPDVAVVEAARQWGCQAVYSQRCHTHEEEIAAEKVADTLPHYTFEGATLVHPDDLPFDVEDLPEIFTRFRKKVEKGGLIVRDLQPVPDIPPPPSELPAEPVD
ncbi:MAG: deoxyribodipyrimidine photo-lyase, partial [Flavobacteriales bacterium]